MSQINNFNHDKITTVAGRVAMTSLLSLSLSPNCAHADNKTQQTLKGNKSMIFHDYLLKFQYVVFSFYQVTFLVTVSC